jgi:hypothetical protein
MSPSSSSSPVIVLTPAQFDDQFAGLFEREAYRLELLDFYNGPGIEDRLRRFQAGLPDNQTARERQMWDTLLARCRRTGRTISRVHVLGEPPHSGYLQFELDFYRGSVAAGEDIRILPQAAATRLDLPGFDYWLFDGARAAVMVYDPSGTWLRSEIVTEAGFVSRCRHGRDVAMAHAIPLTGYLRERATA